MPHDKVFEPLDGGIGIVECLDPSMMAFALATSDAPAW